MKTVQLTAKEADRTRRVLDERLSVGPELLGQAAGSRWGPKLLRPYKRKRFTHKREKRAYSCKLYRPHILAEAIQLLHPQESSRYAVNIGAGDGVSCIDPVYPLYVNGWPGVAIEGMETTELARNLPQDSVRTLDGTLVLPDTVADLLRNADCPDEPGFLKTDIDGYDGPILAAILEAGFRPQVIQAEIQPEFPPPVEFAVLYDPNYRVFNAEGRVDGFYGASFSYMLNLAKPYGYRLAYMDNVTRWTHDITLVHESYLNIAAAVFGPEVLHQSDRERFLAHPPGHSHFNEYGVNTLEWRYRTDYEALLEDVRTACDRANLRKHNGHAVPYHLAIGPS